MRGQTLVIDSEDGRLIRLKHNRIYRVITALIISTAFTLSSVSPAYAKVFEDKRKDYEDAEESAEANKNTAAQLMEDIQEVNQKIAGIALGIEEANDEVIKLDGEIEEAERNLIEIQDDIDAERQNVADALAIMYESMETEDSLALLLKADDLDDIINQEQYMADYSDFIKHRIDTLDTSLEEEESAKEDLEALKYEREEQLSNYDEQKDELDSEMKELNSLMEEAQERAENAEAFAEQLRGEVMAIEAAQREILGARGYNGASSNVIFDGDGSEFYYSSPYPYDDDELTLLAGIIEAEAGSVSYNGMIAVGSVVMNRVESPNFANTIAGVVYAPYQFEPAETGILAVILARGPAESCYQAAQEVLDGKRNVPNFYFKAAWYAEANGIEGVNIGGNVFH